jgi:hypothetical protein
MITREIFSAETGHLHLVNVEGLVGGDPEAKVGW